MTLCHPRCGCPQPCRPRSSRLESPRGHRVAVRPRGGRPEKGPGRQRPCPKPLAGVLVGRLEHVTRDPVPEAARDPGAAVPLRPRHQQGPGASSGQVGRGAEARGAGESGRVLGAGRGQLRGQARLCTRPPTPRDSPGAAALVSLGRAVSELGAGRVMNNSRSRPGPTGCCQRGICSAPPGCQPKIPVLFSPRGQTQRPPRASAAVLQTCDRTGLRAGPGPQDWGAGGVESGVHGGLGTGQGCTAPCRTEDPRAQAPGAPQEAAWGTRPGLCSHC